MNRIVLGLLIVAVAAGCKKQKTQVTPVDGGPGARATPREAAPGKPKVDAAKLDGLAATEVPGFVRTPVPSTRLDFLRIAVWESQTANAKGQKIRVHGTIEPCARCAPPGPETIAKLKRNLSSRASADPDLIWETGELDLGGTKALFAYHVATSEYSPVDGGIKLRAIDNGVEVSFDNGTLHLHLAASGAQVLDATTEAALQAELSRDEMLAAVKTVFAALQPNL